MKPIINPIYFYLISVCGDLKLAFMLAVFIGVVVATICIIVFITMKYKALNYEDEEYADKHLKVSIKCFIACIIMCFTSCFIPSEDTCYKMMAASIVTPDNITAVGNSAQDITDYIIDTINKISEEKTSEGDK